METRKVPRTHYRNRMEIAAGILEVAKSGSRKTRIMYLGNLSFDLVQKYLDLLADADLIQIRENGTATRYFTTEKGQQFLDDFNELQEHSEVVREKKRALERTLNPAV
jgi:predicted transcriptional regulator